MTKPFEVISDLEPLLFQKKAGQFCLEQRVIITQLHPVDVSYILGVLHALYHFNPFLLFLYS